METAQPIAQYYYTYGLGQDFNRVIEFFRQVPDDPTTLVAQVKGDFEGRWQVSSLLKSENIEVDMHSTTEKMRLLLEARQKDTMPIFEKNFINQFNIDQQNNLLNSLHPNGPRKLEIENLPNDQHSLEKVKRITIFDPS